MQWSLYGVTTGRAQRGTSEGCVAGVGGWEGGMMCVCGGAIRPAGRSSLLPEARRRWARGRLSACARDRDGKGGGGAGPRRERARRVISRPRPPPHTARVGRAHSHSLWHTSTHPHRRPGRPGAKREGGSGRSPGAIDSDCQKQTLAGPASDMIASVPAGGPGGEWEGKSGRRRWREAGVSSASAMVPLMAAGRAGRGGRGGAGGRAGGWTGGWTEGASL